MAYYTLHSNTCQLTTRKIIIKIKVPIIEINAKWDIFQYTPIHFSYNNEICIFQSIPAMVGHNCQTNEVKIISGVALEQCDQKLKLCYIDKFEEHSPALQCIRNLYLHAPLETLNEIWAFQCYSRHNFPIIQKISDSAYVITNPQKIFH